MVHWIHFVFPLFLSFGPSGSLSAQKSQKRPQDAPMSRAKALGDEVSSILNTIREGYDKRVRPNYGGEPVVVGLTMYVLSISSLSEVFMDFTMDFYFRQTWKDPRLKFSGPPGMTTLTIGTEFLKTLWVPDTFFVNEKKSYFHTATTQNEFVRISQEGDVTRSIRLTVTATCPMDLRYFPMDRQLCTLEIESFGYTMSDIRYKWAKGASSVGVSSDVSLPQFKVMGYRQQAMEISLSTGNYSRLACEIQFVRSMGYYLIQIYIPSSLIVVISWVSFWLNRAATPARVALGVTTVLTMTTLMASTNAALPKVSYVKSIDVYLGTCFVMVFSSLLEYATLGYLGKRIAIRKNRYESLKKKAEEKLKEMEEEARKNFFDSILNKKHTKQPMGCMGFQMHKRDRGSSSKSQGGQTPEGKPATGAGGGGGKEGDVENPVDLIIPPPKDLNKLYGMTPSDIDKYSRIIFPVCFICFKLTYWIIYLHISDVVEGDLVLLEKDD